MSKIIRVHTTMKVLRNGTMNNSIKMSTIVRKELGNRLVLILIVSMEMQVRKQVKQVIYQHRIQLEMVPLA